MSVNPGQFHGIGVDAYFRDADRSTPPFPSAGGLKSRRPYDQSLVEEAVRRGETAPVDPTTLYATQPWVTRAGVSHYASGATELYADKDRPGNQHPVVYHRTNDLTGQTQSLILSGHHRATAALLNGQQLNAIQVHGGFGERIR